MYHAIWTVLQGTIEWQEFQKHGFWTAKELGAIGVVITSCMEIWGLWHQGAKIWKDRSGETISVTMFNYTTSYYLVCGLYGISICSGAAAFSGIVSSVIQLPLLVGLWKFKKTRWWEYILICLFPLMPLLMFFAPTEWKGVLFLSCSVGVVTAFGSQVKELFDKKHPGDLDINLFIIYAITTIVWMVFVISVGNVPLIISQSVTTVLIFVIVGQWCWYKKHPK